MPTFNAAQTARVGTMIEMTGDILTQLIIHSNQKTMSSREIAEVVGSTHDSVLKTVRRLIAEGVVSGNETPYTHPQNGQTYPEFILDFRNTMVVASGYSAELRARIVDRWQELESKSSFQIPTTLSAALRLAADQADTIEAQQAKLAITTPKAEALDRITLSDGSMCLTNAAKVLGMPPKKFIDWMQQHEWIYRRAGSSKHIGYQSRVQAGYLDHKVTTVSRTDGTEKTVEQVLVTTKGLAKLAQVVGAGGQGGLFGGGAA